MPKASPDQEITLYILSIVQYLEEQPTDPLQPVGYMPYFGAKRRRGSLMGEPGPTSGIGSSVIRRSTDGQAS
jgi:hypothetical protein